MENISTRIKKKESENTSIDHTLSLPPKVLTFRNDDEAATWLDQVKQIADEIVYSSNQYSKEHSKGCIRGNSRQCRARFPQEIINESYIEKETGAIRLRKTEE